jgi:hypothetical protein
MGSSHLGYCPWGNLEAKKAKNNEKHAPCATEPGAIQRHKRNEKHAPGSTSPVAVPTKEKKKKK